MFHSGRKLLVGGEFGVTVEDQGAPSVVGKRTSSI